MLLPLTTTRRDARQLKTTLRHFHGPKQVYFCADKFIVGGEECRAASIKPDILLTSRCRFLPARGCHTCDIIASTGGTFSLHLTHSSSSSSNMVRSLKSNSRSLWGFSHCADHDGAATRKKKKKLSSKAKAGGTERRGG